MIAGVGVTALPYLTDVDGLQELTGPVALPPLPQVGAALTQRAGWNPAFKRSLSSKILGIWTDFQNERGAQAVSRLDVLGSANRKGELNGVCQWSESLFDLVMLSSLCLAAG